MSDDVLEQIKAQIRMPVLGDKVTIDKRLKAEVILMRHHVRIIEDKPGFFVCEARYGRGVADQKESILIDTVTNKPIRWQPYKSHLCAVHSSLCWAVLGISVG
jgi:hypothetical protein